jgi:serine protease
MHLFRKTPPRQVLVIAACLGLFVVSGRGQDRTPGQPGRVLVQDTGLDGIDRGLRDQDPPRNPRGRETRMRGLVVRDDGSTEPARYRWGSVVVKFRDGAASTAKFSAMRDVGASGMDQPTYADFEIMNIPAGADPETVSATLRAREDVEYAQPRYLNHPMARPNDPLFDRQWNFTAIDMERAWDIQPAAGDQITVAVLDSGVAFRNASIRYTSGFQYQLEPGGPLYPPLGTVTVPFAVAPELGASKFVSPRDFIWDDDLPFDLDGHGTHVSGTVGQLTNNGVGVAGFAYNVHIMPVKVLDGTWDYIFDSPNVGTDDIVARGIRYAADNGAKVINMSLGREGGGPATVVTEAVRYAVAKGVFVAVAAGNTGDIGNAGNRAAEGAPSIDGFVAVSAVGRSLDRAYYSTSNAYVELAAPGGDQRRDGSTGGVLQQTIDLDFLETFDRPPGRVVPPRADIFDYFYFQGTSMSAPHVAAFAAMLMQQGITSPAAIEAAMKLSARDLGAAGQDNVYGAGLIQPRVALRGLGLAK